MFSSLFNFEIHEVSKNSSYKEQHIPAIEIPQILAEAFLKFNSSEVSILKFSCFDNLTTIKFMKNVMHHGDPETAQTHIICL